MSVADHKKKGLFNLVRSIGGWIAISKGRKKKNSK